MQYRGMFVYPWDLGAEPQRFLERYQALGCNMMAVNGSYHQMSTFGLRVGHAYGRPFAGTSFEVDEKRYGRIVPRSVVHLDSVYEELREACAARGIDWRCWMVNLHNDDIGERYPDTCVQNAWGDRYPSSLCVNHPDVQEYAVHLLEDVIRLIAPSRVIMETESFMPAFHGRHHEFTLARLTPAVRYLSSLCFCPHCMREAERSGIDTQAVRTAVRNLLERLLREDVCLPGHEDAQLLQVFMEYPEIYSYQQFRYASVTKLTVLAADAAHARHVLYECIPSAYPFAINHMHYEGTLLRALDKVVDGFVPLCYAPEEDYIQILRNMRLFTEAPVALALNLGRTRYANWDEFSHKLAEGALGGAESIYCYNYGLATDEALQQMKKAYAALQKEEEEGHDTP